MSESVKETKAWSQYRKRVAASKRGWATRRKREFDSKLANSLAQKTQEALFVRSFLSGVFADLGLVGVGEEIAELYRTGQYRQANALAVRAIESAKACGGSASEPCIEVKPVWNCDRGMHPPKWCEPRQIWTCELCGRPLDARARARDLRYDEEKGEKS
jgi:hypothetical protein